MVVVEQEEQPVGQTTATPPTKAVETVVDGLLMQRLAASLEKPRLQMVQTVAEVQVSQSVGQEAQAPDEMKYVVAQEVQTEPEVQMRQLVEQVTQLVVLS